MGSNFIAILAAYSDIPGVLNVVVKLMIRSSDSIVSFARQVCRKSKSSRNGFSLTLVIKHSTVQLGPKVFCPITRHHTSRATKQFPAGTRDGPTAHDGANPPDKSRAVMCAPDPGRTRPEPLGAAVALRAAGTNSEFAAAGH